MENHEIERFLTAIEQSFKYRDQASWPAPAVKIEPYFSEFAALDFYRRVNTLRVRRINATNIAKCFVSPSMLVGMLVHFVIPGLKVAKKYTLEKLNQQDITNFVKFLFTLLKEKHKGDIFCLDGSNKILTKQEIISLLRNIQLNNIENEEQRREFNSFITASYALVWSLYFDIFAQFGMEIHGPYNVSRWFGPKSVLLIRDLFDLRSSELWSHSKTSPYKSIRILAIYKDLDITIDFINHIYSKSTIGDKLTHFYIIVDGKSLSLKEIISLRNEISEFRKRQVAYVSTLKPKEIIHKAAEICYYSFKDVSKLAGEDWRPPKEIKEQISTIGLKYWNKGIKESQSIEYIKRLFDPRTNFYG